MTQVWDEEAQATAIKAALVAAMPASVGVYDPDEVPVERPATFLTVTPSRRYVPERRFGGDVTLPGGRLVIEYAARSVTNVRAMRRYVTAALEGVILPGDLGPFTYETSDEVDGRDGWFDAADFFTY